jgi:hypothetical protein
MRASVSIWRLFRDRKVAMALAMCTSFGLLGANRDASAVNYYSWGVELCSGGLPAPMCTGKANGTLQPPSYGSLNGLASNFYTPDDSSGWHHDCTVSHSGSCSVKGVIRGNDLNEGGGIDFIQPNPPYGFSSWPAGGKALYYRWWMRIESGFNFGASGTVAKMKASRTGVTDSSPAYTGYLWFPTGASGFIIGECSTQSGCLSNTGAGASDDMTIKINYRFVADSQWHEYIVMVKPNTSVGCTAGANCDAQFHAWVDGVLVGTYDNFKLSDGRVSGSGFREMWGAWMTAVYVQSNSAFGGTIYVDDFSTDDSYNSTFSGGGAAPLPAPTNLRVQ